MNNTEQKHKLNSGSIVITWSAIGSMISFLCYISDLLKTLSFTTSHYNPTKKRCQTWFTTRNSLLLNRNRNYHVHRSLPEIPVMSQTHSIKTSHLILLTWNLCYLQISMGQHSSKVTRIYTRRSGVQNLADATKLSIIQNIQTSSSTHPASNSMKTKAFSLAVKWPVQTVWPLTSV